MFTKLAGGKKKFLIFYFHLLLGSDVLYFMLELSS